MALFSDSDDRKRVFGIYFLVFGTLVLGLGIVGDVFAATFTHNGCSSNLKKFFLGVGIVYTIAGVCELIVGLMCLFAGSDTLKIGIAPLIFIHCSGIPAFVFLILGSIWVWQQSNDYCQSQDNPWLRAKIYLIVMYVMIGLNCCVNYLLFFLIGNATKAAFMLDF